MGFAAYILAGLSIFLLLLLSYMRFEAGFLKVERVFFGKSGKGLKIAHISDVHINRLKVRPDSLIALLKQEKPDIVILTGDYVEKPEQVPMFINFLKEIRKCADDILLCFGNHDHTAFHGNSKGFMEFAGAIESAGATVLHDQSVFRAKNRRKYNIIGLADLRCGGGNAAKALETCRPDADINIAFTHNPDIVFAIPPGKVDYLLCGHFHGGQVWMPFNLEFRSLRHDRLCRMGMNKGVHKWGGIVLYISRGIGNVCLPLRFLSRPEITFYTFP